MNYRSTTFVFQVVGAFVCSALKGSTGDFIEENKIENRSRNILVGFITTIIIIFLMWVSIKLMTS